MVWEMLWKIIVRAERLNSDVARDLGRGHEKFQDFAGKKIALDDREIVRSFLAA